MGIQSFKFPVDFLNNLEKPIIYIANKHKEILASVAVYDDLSLTCNLNAYQTASFKIYQYVDGVKQDYFKLFEEEMLIMIPGISWYEIHVETNIEPTGISKSITANSLECRLCDKRLVDFQINCNDLDIEDYAIIPFCNFSDPEHSLLHKVLNVSPTWSVGHVDESLINKQRTFDVDDTDVYSFLTSEVSEAFNCLFTFDTFNQTVNAYDLDNYGQDTNIFVSMDNLAQNMSQTIDENSIFTCYRVNGGDDIQIAEVNPNGTNKIYNFEYYLPQMPQELQNKIKAYNEKYQSEKPHYEDVVARMQTQIEVIQELYTRIPDSATSTDWTTYGLEMLQSMQKQCEAQDQAYCASGMNQPTSLSYNLYKENLQKLNEVKAEIEVRQSQINVEEEKWKVIDNELIAIQQEFNMDNWFTLDEWKMLDNYVVEETYSNDNFGTVDNTDEAELFSMEKELYDKAWKDLSKKCRPQYQYSATLSNVLTIPEFKDFIPYFELGNFIRMETDYDTVIKLRLISFTVDYSNTQTINVTFSDAIRVKDVYEDSASIQAQANSAAMSFQFNKDQYDKSVREGNFVSEMRKYGLDVATTQIYNATDQSQTWDSTGMTFRKWNDERQDFDPEMIKIINNMMVFLDGDGARMAIGKISLPNGNSCYGINCELLVNKLTMSENVWIENDSGTYKFDDAGFIASSGKNSVRIQPNQSGELFSIYKGNNKQVYINSDGDVEFAGSLKSASGQFSGLVSGGSININNKFIVDKDGNVTLPNNATISWGQVTGTENIAYTSDIPTDVNQLKDASGQKWSTTVGENWIKTSKVYAQNLQVGAANIQGKLTASQIETDNLTVSSAATISGTISCDKLSGGTIKGQNLEGCKAVFNDGADAIRIKYFDKDDWRYYMGLRAGYMWIHNESNPNVINGIICDNNFNVGVNDNTDTSLYPRTYIYFHKDNVNGDTIEFYCNGNRRPLWRKYVNGQWLGYEIAIKNDLPDMSNYATKNDINTFITGIDVNLTSQSGTSGYTKNYFLHVSGAGKTASVNAAQIHVSDRRLKEFITEAQDISRFYMLLNPVHFKYKDDVEGVDGHWHYGFIAQDVKQAFVDAGIESYNEALVGHDVDNDVWLLDKDEFHAMHVQMIQKHQREIESLQRQIKELERKIS